MKKDKEKISVQIFYKNYEKNIAELKEKILIDYKELITGMGFIFIAEWLDFRHASIYEDRFLVKYENMLYSLHMSNSHSSVCINSLNYRRFDTINFKSVKIHGLNKLYGYSIDEDGFVTNNHDKTKHPRINYTSEYVYVYRDLLRKNKIKNLLEECGKE